VNDAVTDSALDCGEVDSTWTKPVPLAPSDDASEELATSASGLEHDGSDDARAMATAAAIGELFFTGDLSFTE
jgi:hypothetical protein